jgi:hypothetical protein
MEEQKQNQQTYQEKKEAKLQERAARRGNDKRQHTNQTLIRWGAALIIVGVIGYGIFILVKRSLPQGEDMSIAIPIQGRGHIAVGSEHEAYNSNPPSSGPHYAETAVHGFYEKDEIVPDENIVHNLEHGDIWISYHPRISDSVLDTLRGFADSRIVIAPRAANEFDIGLAAWGRIDTLSIENDLVPTERIKDFISRYINRGPERVPASGFVRGGHQL